MMPSSSGRSGNGGCASVPPLPVERLVVLVDIKAWQCCLALPVEESVRRICEVCVRACPSCVWAFKLFDSSLFPLRSASRVKSAVGTFAANVRFDPIRSDPTLARFRSALKCLSLSENATPKPSQQEAGKDDKNEPEKDEGGRADYVARCLHELLTDYTWEPLLRQDNPSSPDDFSGETPPSSNLVVLLSSLPHTRCTFSRFICPEKPQNLHVSDEELCSSFVLRFKSIEESFKSKNIHLSWIDFPPIPSSLLASIPDKRESNFTAIPQIFERTSLTYLRLDTFLIASEVAPLHLIWTTLAYPPFLTLRHRKPTSLTLRISIEDRNKEQLKHSLCKIDLTPFAMHSLNEMPMDKAELCAILRRGNISKMGPFKRAFLCHAKANKRNPQEGKRENNKNVNSENVDMDPIGDRVFLWLKQRCSEFTPGKPAWQLLMLYLSREKSIGVVDVYSEGGSKFLALLEPLTVHSAVLRIVEDITSISELLHSIGCVRHSSSSSSSSLVACDETKGSDSPSKKDLNFIIAPKLAESFNELKHEKDSRVSTNCNKPNKKQPASSQLLHADLFGRKGSEEVTHIKTRSKRVKSVEEQGWEALWANVMSRLSRNEGAAATTLKISKLEDLYLKRRDCSKHLKILSCWMKQNRQKLRLCHSSTSNTVDFSSQETSCTVGASQTLANEEAMQDLDETARGGVGGVNSSSALSLDEKQTVEEEHFREAPDSILASIDAKMSECLLSPEIDLNNFARRIVSDAYNSVLSLHREKLMLSETPDGASIGSPELNTKLILVNNLTELFLQKPKKLEVKYRTRRPLPISNEPTISNSNRGEYLYASEQKVREYELQIVLRLELLLVVGPSVEIEKVKDSIVKEICSLLENIQFNLPGGIFEGESLLDFSNKIIKTRYKDCLSDIVNEIYEKMELNGHDEEDIDAHEIVGKEPSQIVEVEAEAEGEEVAMDCGLSESSMHMSWGGVGGTEISDHISSPSKVTPSMEEDSIPMHLANSISIHRPSETAELSPDRRRYEEAQAKRERAMQFSHFASRAKALLRVRVIKPSGKGVKKRSKTQSKVPKSKSRLLVSNEVVQETPLASSKLQGRCPTREAEQEDALLQAPPISHCRASLYSRLV